MSVWPSFSRRQFLLSASATAGLLAAGKPSWGRAATPGLRILEPIDGAVVHRRLGRELPDGLEIALVGTARPNDRVLIQGRPAIRDGETFRAAAILKDRQTQIRVVAEGEGRREQADVGVVWDQHSQKRYRFSIDDNSFFLRDVTQKRYRSLFDCFYLKMLRDLHVKYGTCFTLNIYYTTGDGWDLRQFPDKYRSQWQDNASWLRLAFHAYANDPPRPYQDAPVEKLLADVDLVAEQIHRFAGPATYSPPTVIHWGMTRPEAWKALYERGARVLGGYMRRQQGTWDINYRLDDLRSEWLSRHDLLQDFSSGIIFSKIDLVVNNTPLQKIVPTLEPLIADPCQGEIIDLLTHEQYFWPFYKNYLPDHPQRVQRAIELVSERGYKPVFLQDGFLGA